MAGMDGRTAGSPVVTAAKISGKLHRVWNKLLRSDGNVGQIGYKLEDLARHLKFVVFDYWLHGQLRVTTTASMINMPVAN